MKNVRADHYIISKIVKNNSRILDIGCADGQLLHLLEKEKNVWQKAWWQEILMAEWRGMKVKLNSPSAIRKGEPGYGRKAKKVFVMSNGKVKKVMFGDPNMPVRKNNPKARASFRARHKCSTAKDKTTARYWACRDW